MTRFIDVTGQARTALPPKEPLGRCIGIDLGAEYGKIVELTGNAPERLQRSRVQIIEHRKEPGPALVEALKDWNWEGVSSAVVTGRFAGRINLPRIPVKQAQLAGFRFLVGDPPAIIVSIGSQGFSVLEISADGMANFRENSRCSQGTGNFLRQLVERFSLSVEEAGVLCSQIENPAALSGRCPVILKTDMTHLANKGEDRARILAGLFDAVCENVLLLVKPQTEARRVLLAGGVSRAPRVQRVMACELTQRGFEVIIPDEEEGLCLEAIGSAVVAHGQAQKVPPLEELLLRAPVLSLEKLPPLRDSLRLVRQLPTPPRASTNGSPPDVVIGFDIGSTGSKLVALDSHTEQVLWEGYRRTLGDPVGAAQDLLRQFQSGRVTPCRIGAFGVTGSGREITGSLLTSCFGEEAVLVVNEIVAHATGALQYDSRVDTIFEIGGQDAKYIRLAAGRVIDCAMNEACSAGTGSFIEEQGRKFAGIRDLAQLSQEALKAERGVSLGQHCSVFMAEVIDQAVDSGATEPEILSGLYDSIIKNYLHRVKGNRSVGEVIFCQGMPFAAKALAAAVARQTGCQVIVPPNPGTVGALGIALLARRELHGATSRHLDPEHFLSAKVEHKDTFVCKSTTGCGGAGNRCRIERLRTIADGNRSSFTWGGSCLLHDKGTRKRKLPPGTPDPFRAREELLRSMMARYAVRRGRPRIAVSDEFMMRGLLPFFVAFFDEAGHDLDWIVGADQATLKRGIQIATVGFCAPMQIFHGIAEQMLESGAEFAFVPMVRSLPAPAEQPVSTVCPIVQAGPDLLSSVLPTPGGARRWLSPVINFGPQGLDSPEFKESCRNLGVSLGLRDGEWHRAWTQGVAVQRKFDEDCFQLGQAALDFCEAEDLLPIVVLGRTYTIYNSTLNSNVPAILREQGAVAIPMDCYPLHAQTPLFPGMYWAYGQTALRTAHQVRRTPGLYALYCSNYACGPDSFNLHFVGSIMQGKPFAVIETDGHSGDAGTRTRVEAFLHCVEADRQNGTRSAAADFREVRPAPFSIAEYRRNHCSEIVLVPHMGPAADVVAAVLRGLGLRAEALPPPDIEALRLGRRYTSGKECLPLPLTIGSLLQRLDRSGPQDRYIILFPSSIGPCRFGVYHLLGHMLVDRAGWSERARLWSPDDNNYFSDCPGGTEVLAYSAIVASDLLAQARLDARPFEQANGLASEVYRSAFVELLQLVETCGRKGAGLGPALWQVASGKLFGIPELLSRVAASFRSVTVEGQQKPVIELTGEIYVRSVDVSNDSLIGHLENRGMRVRLAPVSEWFAYCAYLRRDGSGPERWANRIGAGVEARIEGLCRKAMAKTMGWTEPPGIPEILNAAETYLNPALLGESVLTLGATLHAWRRGEIDAVVNVGPLECMPGKIAEAQFYEAARREGLLSLSLCFDGAPLNTTAIDNFTYEVYQRWSRTKDAPKRRVCTPTV